MIPMQSRAKTGRGGVAVQPETQAILARDKSFAAVILLGIVAGQWWMMNDLSVQDHWVLAALVLVELTAVVIAYFLRPNQRRLRRAIELGVAGFLVSVNLFNLAALARQAFFTARPAGAIELLFTGMVLWIMNVMAFALFYWLIDGGGPELRATGRACEVDFVFPQQNDSEHARPDWYPSFGDYLYLAFTAASSFGPTDAMPYTRRAKAAMALEGAIALATLGVIIARAVSLATD
jgi:uncharacterized membrane protein (DUF373 family)